MLNMSINIASDYLRDRKMKVNTKSEKALVLTIVAVNLLKNKYSKYIFTRPKLEAIMIVILHKYYSFLGSNVDEKFVSHTTWKKYFIWVKENRLAEHVAV